MAPIVRLSIYLSLLASISALAGLRSRTAVGATEQDVLAVASAPNTATCPRGTLNDNAVCIPVPSGGIQEGEPLEPEANWHRDHRGEIVAYDQIPRRPERPKEYSLYRYPVDPLPFQSLMMSGYDLHLPDEMQRRGAKLKAIGHGGIDLAQRRGAEVHLVGLENQIDKAEVLYVGHLFGNTVVTRHEVKEAGTTREYLAIFGHLEAASHTLLPGQLLNDGDLVGYVGDSDSPGIVHLHYELRQIRVGVDAHSLKTSHIADNAHTVACDPRNLLPLREQR